MLNWIKDKWASFEAWVHTWFPGYKTTITTGLGALASFAGVAQEYISGLPLEQFVTSKTLALISGSLFTLSFWFKDMGDRVDARNS